jgi:hypothetical protein
VGPNFTRPTASAAARYTGDTLRSENASTNDTVQHIALGRETRWDIVLGDQVKKASILGPNFVLRDDPELRARLEQNKSVDIRWSEVN